MNGFRAFLVVVAAMAIASLSGPSAQVDTIVDERSKYNEEFEARPGPAQIAALGQFQEGKDDLRVSLNDDTGATRTLYRFGGRLFAPTEGDTEERTRQFLTSNHDLLGLTLEDVGNSEIIQVVPSKHAGTKHVYLQQTHLGLAVHDGQLQINYDRDGGILSINNLFMPDLAGSINTTAPEIDAPTAVLLAAEFLGRTPDQVPRTLTAPHGVRRETTLDPAGLSLDPVQAALSWLPLRRGDARLVWKFGIRTPDGVHARDLNVDAVSGKVWTAPSRVAHLDTYHVYEHPTESPTHPGAAADLALPTSSAGLTAHLLPRLTPGRGGQRLAVRQDSAGSQRSCIRRRGPE